MEKQVQKPFNFGVEVVIKGLIILGMIVIMLIPIMLLRGMVNEREERKNEAVAAIGNSWSRSQTVCGPILSVPFVKLVKDGKGKTEEVRTVLSFTPDRLDITAEILPETRKYGMYEAILYKSSLRFSGEFAPIEAVSADFGRPELEKAILTMEVGDMRGLTDRLTIDLAGKNYAAQAGGVGDLSNGRTHRYSNQLSVKPELNTLGETMPFECTMELKGSEGLHFVPIGRTTDVILTGNWSHPSFTGGFAPDHNVGADNESDDFTAHWRVLDYNREIPDSWVGGLDELNHTAFGVELVTGTDQYQQNERAVKYALLFVVLTFVVFFFVEILTCKRIHAVQYLLVGAALLIFYTLLLSISEIVGFGWAYLFSSCATVGLITLYTATIFKSARQTALLSGILSGLYAYLYFILQIENYTLLVGSVGLFAILAVVMFVSRRVNWYGSETPA